MVKSQFNTHTRIYTMIKSVFFLQPSSRDYTWNWGPLLTTLHAGIPFLLSCPGNINSFHSFPTIPVGAVFYSSLNHTTLLWLSATSCKWHCSFHLSPTIPKAVTIKLYNWFIWNSMSNHSFIPPWATTQGLRSEKPPVLYLSNPGTQIWAGDQTHICWPCTHSIN